jgi:hypothetical protein
MNMLLNSSPAQFLPLQAMENLFLTFKGTSFAGLQTLTDARAKKTDNPFPQKIVLKESQLLVNVGFQYSNSLDNQAKREHKEIDFQIQPRKWGTRIKGTSLVEHKGNYYLETKVEKVYSTRYVDIDGNELNKEDVLPFLPKKRESSTQDELEKKIYLRDFKLSSIKRLAFGGKMFLVG